MYTVCVAAIQSVFLKVLFQVPILGTQYVHQVFGGGSNLFRGIFFEVLAPHWFTVGSSPPLGYIHVLFMKQSTRLARAGSTLDSLLSLVRLPRDIGNQGCMQARSTNGLQPAVWSNPDKPRVLFLLYHDFYPTSNMQKSQLDQTKIWYSHTGLILYFQHLFCTT